MNKYIYGWRLSVNYGQGYEYEIFEDTRTGYLENKKAYQENCDYPQRWSRGRELSPAWETAQKKRVNPKPQIKKYIIDRIDGDGYGEALDTDRRKLLFLRRTFISEYGWCIERIGFHDALAEWLSGLPSAIHIEFYYCDMIPRLITWGLLQENSPEHKVTDQCNSWFNRLAQNICELFRTHKIGAE